MKIIITLFVCLLFITGFTQPNSDPNGKGQGLENPRNPNNNVPIDGIEIMILAGALLGSYFTYKRMKNM